MRINIFFEYEQCRVLNIATNEQQIIKNNMN